MKLAWFSQYTEQKILNKQIYARESMRTARKYISSDVQMWVVQYDPETSLLIYYPNKEDQR